MLAAVLGLLPLGLVAAWAEQRAPAQVRPAPPANADTLKERDKELEAIRAEQRRALENEAKLKREIESIGDDRRKFNQQLIDTAARVVSIEDRIAQTQERLKPLDEGEEALRKSLEERRYVIAEVLAALQRIGRHAPPAILIRAEDALQAVRSAMMLGAVLPEMRVQAEALAADLAALVRLRQQIAEERDRLGRDLLVLADDRQRLSLLIDERQKRQADAEKALADERARAAQLARQAADLRELIAKLEANLETGTRTARTAARAGEDRKASGQPARHGRAQGPRPADPGDRLRFRQRKAALTGQRGENPGIWGQRRAWGHRKGALDRHPGGRPGHGSVRRMGGLFRGLPQLWPTLDPKCRRRVSCLARRDGTNICRSRAVRGDGRARRGDGWRGTVGSRPRDK